MTTVPPTTLAPTTSPTTTVPATATGPPYQGWVTRLVEQEVPPGLLTAESPEGRCSWERQQIAEDGTTTAITHGISARPLVEVLPTDDAVKSNGCGPWVPYSPPASPATTVSDGDWLVGSDLIAGRYQAASPPERLSECYWERDDSFLYEFGGWSENNIVDRRTVVDLTAGERFTTKGCGPWMLAP
ncbi:MAG TPA: hypothetical protein VK611_11205 [Acidimicrobiales bacterium]|nr:hypothetical protein [Acidimicrobiales bacterium]